MTKWTELQRQANDRLSAMGANGGDERLGEALGRLPAIVTSRSASRTQKVIMLRRVADAIAETVAPHAVCKRGCSMCCHQHIMISELEARLIESATGRKRASPPRVGPRELEATSPRRSSAAT
jgi:hypothetical protein